MYWVITEQWETPTTNIFKLQSNHPFWAALNIHAKQISMSLINYLKSKNTLHLTLTARFTFSSHCSIKWGKVKIIFIKLKCFVFFFHLCLKSWPFIAPNFSTTPAWKCLVVNSTFSYHKSSLICKNCTICFKALISSQGRDTLTFMHVLAWRSFINNHALEERKALQLFHITHAASPTLPD